MRVFKVKKKEPVKDQWFVNLMRDLDAYRRRKKVGLMSAMDREDYYIDIAIKIERYFGFELTLKQAAKVADQYADHGLLLSRPKLRFRK